MKKIEVLAKIIKFAKETNWILANDLFNKNGSICLKHPGNYIIARKILPDKNILMKNIDDSCRMVSGGYELRIVCNHGEDGMIRLPFISHVCTFHTFNTFAATHFNFIASEIASEKEMDILIDNCRDKLLYFEKTYKEQKSINKKQELNKDFE